MIAGSPGDSRPRLPIGPARSRRVGYVVHIPLSTFYDLPDQESPASLWIHTHVREDALALYGFLTERERALFLMLLGSRGRPRVA